MFISLGKYLASWVGLHLHFGRSTFMSILMPAYPAPCVVQAASLLCTMHFIGVNVMHFVWHFGEFLNSRCSMTRWSLLLLSGAQVVIESVPPFHGQIVVPVFYPYRLHTFRNAKILSCSIKHWLNMQCYINKNSIVFQMHSVHFQVLFNNMFGPLLWICQELPVSPLSWGEGLWVSEFEFLLSVLRSIISWV